MWGCVDFERGLLFDMHVCFFTRPNMVLFIFCFIVTAYILPSVLTSSDPPPPAHPSTPNGPVSLVCSYQSDVLFREWICTSWWNSTLPAPLFLNLHQFSYFGSSLQILASVLYPHTVHQTKQKLCDYSRLQEPQMKVYAGTYSNSELWAMASSVTKLDFEAKSCWSTWKVWSMFNSLHFFSSWYCQNTFVASASYSLSWKKGWGSFV